MKNRNLAAIASLLSISLAASLTSCGSEDELPSWAFGEFIRPEGVNPLINPDTSSTFFCPMRSEVVKWQCADTFNPAAVEKDGKIVILYRAEDDPTAGIGGRTSRLGYAESADGITIDSKSPVPVMYPDSSQISRRYEWKGGCEDPRIVEAETDDGTKYVMTYTSWNNETPRLSIATSSDLVHWTHHGPAFLSAMDGRFKDLGCKSGSIVTKIQDGRLKAAKVNVNGESRYLMYWGELWVCAATSDDLINWTPLVDSSGELIYLAEPIKGRFDSSLTECGPPALITDRGIILFYNGKNADTEDEADRNYPLNTYSAGQMLFSLKDPTRLVDRLPKPFFRPTTDFEKSGQFVSGTVFIEGLVFHQDRWFLYYGCADSKVGVAVFDPSNPGDRRYK